MSDEQSKVLTAEEIRHIAPGYRGKQANFDPNKIKKTGAKHIDDTKAKPNDYMSDSKTTFGVVQYTLFQLLKENAENAQENESIRGHITMKAGGVKC